MEYPLAHKLNDIHRDILALLADAANRERVLQAEIDRLQSEAAVTAKLTDMEIDGRDTAWRDEIARLRGKCNRLIDGLANFGGDDDWNWEALGVRDSDREWEYTPESCGAPQESDHA